MYGERGLVGGTGATGGLLEAGPFSTIKGV